MGRTHRKEVMKIKSDTLRVERDIAGGDITYHIVNIYNSAPGNPSSDSEEFKNALARYLRWMIATQGSIIFRGVQRGQNYSLKLPLAQIYVPLVGDEIRLGRSGQAITERNFFESLERLRTVLGYEPRKQQTGIHHARSNFQKVEFDSILGRSTKLVVTGEPGAGKTVLLQYIAWLLSSCLLEGNQADATEKLGLTGLIPLPILVPLNAYAKHLQEYAHAQDPKLKTLPVFISHYLIHRNASLGLPIDFFERIFYNGETAILLLDGLDEVPTEDERFIVSGAIQDLSHTLPNTRIIVTARSSAYKGNVILPTDFREIKMRALDNQTITIMVSRFYQAVYPDDQDEIKRQSKSLLLSISQLERQRQIGGRRDPLINSPLLARMSIIVHFNERELPNQRAGLYKESVDSMLMPAYNPDSEVAVRLSHQAGNLDLPDQREIYAAIAFYLHSKGKEKTIAESEVKEIIYQTIKNRYSAEKVTQIQEDFLATAADRGSLLVEKFRNYQFIHLGFQEYLAAVHVAETERLPENMVNFYETTCGIMNSWWREPILLAAGYLSLTNPNIAFNYIEIFADIDNARKRPIEQRLTALELAGTMFLEWQNEGPLRERLANAIHEILFNAQNNQLPILLRGAAGRILSQLSDTRTDVIQVIPETILIPAQEFYMGYFDEKFRYVDLPSLRDGRHLIKLDDYFIGKYPVTNHQYSRFIHANGYKNKRYWGEEGWIWKETNNIELPAYWDDVRWNIATSPVVGVSWYEANAYCKWLSEETLQTYRLPTEAEWELAARGTDERLWPWGISFAVKDGYANTLESNIGETTIVGLFPEGKSPFGLLDCAGNVWEWCSSIYMGYPYNSKDGRENFGGYRPRCHRGGSWLNPKEYAICANRDRYFPGDRHYDLGFRVCHNAQKHQ